MIKNTLKNDEMPLKQTSIRLDGKPNIFFAGTYCCFKNKKNHDQSEVRFFPKYSQMQMQGTKKH